MAKLIVHTDEAPKSLAGYSQAVKAGGFIFVSGQGPFNPKIGEIVGTTIQEQTGHARLAVLSRKPLAQLGS